MTMDDYSKKSKTIKLCLVETPTMEISRVRKQNTKVSNKLADDLTAQNNKHHA
jgi:hypothetical protein